MSGNYPYPYPYAPNPPDHERGCYTPPDPHALIAALAARVAALEAAVARMQQQAAPYTTCGGEE